MRYFIEFTYDGTNFYGYQIQPNQKTVQETLENALSIILRQKISIIGAGRTDTGVHAKQIFAHFDFDEELPKNLVFKLNAFLPKDLIICDIFRVIETAHARFDAIWRTYKYYICTKKTPFNQLYSFSIHYQKLNIEAMNICANELLNHEDFKSFSKLHSDNKTTICKIKEAYFTQNEEFIIFTITANRFLRNMVRAIVGTLIEVGRNKISIQEFKQIILDKNRSKAGTSASANALFLDKIIYPKSIRI